MKLNHWKSLIVAILLATGCNRESLIDAIKIPKPKKSDYPSPSTIEYFILGDNVPFLDRSESCAFDDAGNYYHAMFDQKYIVKRNSQLEYVSHFGGLGSGAGQFTTMGDIVIRDDLNEVYVVDSGGNRINVFNKNGTFLRAIGTVGLGLGEFTSPRRMIFGDNKFFVSDNSARIQVFDASFTPLFEYSVNGTSDGEFKNITGLGMDGSNRLWVSDSTRLNIQIFTVDTVGQSLIFTDKITNVDFAGTLSTIQFDSVNDLMWICKTGNKCYSYKTSDFSLQDTVTASNTPVNTCILGRKLYYVSSKSFIGTIDMDTKIYSIAMQGGKGNLPGEIFVVEDASVDVDGNILIADYNNYRFQLFDSDGNFVRVIGAKGAEPSGIVGKPTCVVGDGTFIYATTDARHQVHIFNYAGVFQGILGTGSSGTADGELAGANGLGIDADGNIHVSEFLNNRVSVFRPDGTFVRKYGSAGSGDGELSDPRRIHLEGNTAYVSDRGNRRVVVFDENGGFVRNLNFLGTGSGDGEVSAVNGIWGLTVDSDYAYVTDPGNHRIQVIDKQTGAYVKSYSTLSESEIFNKTFKYPFGVAQDLEGNLVIADSTNSRVIKMNKDGAVIEK